MSFHTNKISAGNLLFTLSEFNEKFRTKSILISLFGLHTCNKNAPYVFFKDAALQVR